MVGGGVGNTSGPRGSLCPGQERSTPSPSPFGGTVGRTPVSGSSSEVCRPGPGETGNIEKSRLTVMFSESSIKKIFKFITGPPSF